MKKTVFFALLSFCLLSNLAFAEEKPQEQDKQATTVSEKPQPQTVEFTAQEWLAQFQQKPVLPKTAPKAK